MLHRYHKLKLYLQDWMNYFAIGIRYQQALDLDQWIRRRIRMCYWTNILLLAIFAFPPSLVVKMLANARNKDTKLNKRWRIGTVGV